MRDASPPGGGETRAGCRVLASTTSHKREPLIPTLEVFGRLGLLDLDLNLHHLVEGDITGPVAAEAIAANGLCLRVLSGGWCDFFLGAPAVEQTFASVARQAGLAATLGAGLLRLFFGRLARSRYTPAALETITANLRRLSDLHPNLGFVFENHDGASLDPQVCRDVFEHVARPNIRMNFDAINFAKAGVDPMAALDLVAPSIGHVHLKGLDRGEYCEFGEGDVNLEPVIRSLIARGYRGSFTVEYEGPFDGTLRLYRSVQRARAVLDA